MPRRPLTNNAGTISELAADALILDEIATPATPASGTVVLYAKSDHHVYEKDSTGAETDLASGGSGSGDLLVAWVGL